MHLHSPFADLPTLTAKAGAARRSVRLAGQHLINRNARLQAQNSPGMVRIAVTQEDPVEPPDPWARSAGKSSQPIAPN